MRGKMDGYNAQIDLRELICAQIYKIPPEYASESELNIPPDRTGHSPVDNVHCHMEKAAISHLVSGKNP